MDRQGDRTSQVVHLIMSGHPLGRDQDRLGKAAGSFDTTVVYRTSWALLLEMF